MFWLQMPHFIGSSLIKVKMKRVHPLGSPKYYNVLSAPHFNSVTGSGFIDANIVCVPVLQLKLWHDGGALTLTDLKLTPLDFLIFRF